MFITSGYSRGCTLLRLERDAQGTFHVHQVYEHRRLCGQFATPVLYKGHIYGFDSVL